MAMQYLIFFRAVAHYGCLIVLNNSFFTRAKIVAETSRNINKSDADNSKVATIESQDCFTVLKFILHQSTFAKIRQYFNSLKCMKFAKIVKTETFCNKSVLLIF